MEYDSNSGSPGNFDLIGLAKQVIYEVDSIRSLSDGKSTNGSSNGGYDESRVNAFLRLIGLPMFVNIDPEKTSGAILNTAYGSYLSSNIENMEELSGFTDLENLKNSVAQREVKYIEEENKVDETRSSSMASSLRRMMPLVPNFPDNMKGNGAIFSSDSENSRTVFKMLFPLIPSYKKINPSNRNVARPFSNNLEIYRDDSLKKPFLETVILIRNVFGQSSASQKGNVNYKKILNSIKETTTEEDYAKISKIVDVMQSSGVEEIVVGKIFSSLSQLSLRYLEIRSKQESLASFGGKFTVSLTTESSKDTFGKKVSAITSGSFDENSQVGSRIIKLRQKLSEEQTHLLLLTGDSSVNISTDNTNNAANSLMSSLFIDLLKKEGESTEKEIKIYEENYKNLSVQADALRLEIDLLTGEFCGLSIIDVIAVIAGLFLIDEKNLFALLDKETKENMYNKAIFKNKQDLLNVSQTEVKDAVDAVLQLQKYVNFVYGYVKSLIGSANDRTKRSVTVPKSTKGKDRNVVSKF